MFAEATRVVDDGIHREHHGAEIIEASRPSKKWCGRWKLWRRPTPRSSCRGKPAPAKSSSLARSISRVSGATIPSSR